MAKVKMGPQTALYPMPTLLIGADVGGKPNFMTAAWAGICNGEPPMVAVAIRPSRFTLKGINENMTFSVNVPTAAQVKEVDYCGIESGSKADKVAVCGFHIFYGKTAGAPLIEECPVNLECKVDRILELGSHNLVIGRVMETHFSDDCLTGGKPDAAKINPIIYIREPAWQYATPGNLIGKTFSIGKELQAKNG
jgi:flavin reductase (DIM6/NTAB) family NADH-FMN oxidoreductase RutF